MIESIAIFLLIFSFVGMVFIFVKNLPKLSLLTEIENENYFTKFKKKLIEIVPFKKFSFEIFLQKIITRIRIISLKVDNLTFNWLRKLRQKYQEKEKREKDNYWEEIKKAKENK